MERRGEGRLDGTCCQETQSALSACTSCRKVQIITSHYHLILLRFAAVYQPSLHPKTPRWVDLAPLPMHSSSTEIFNSALPPLRPTLSDPTEQEHTRGIHSICTSTVGHGWDLWERVDQSASDVEAGALRAGYVWNLVDMHHHPRPLRVDGHSPQCSGSQWAIATVPPESGLDGIWLPGTRTGE